MQKLEDGRYLYKGFTIEQTSTVNARNGRLVYQIYKEYGFFWDVYAGIEKRLTTLAACKDWINDHMEEKANEE